MVVYQLILIKTVTVLKTVTEFKRFMWARVFLNRYRSEPLLKKTHEKTKVKAMQIAKGSTKKNGARERERERRVVPLGVFSTDAWKGFSAWERWKRLNVEQGRPRMRNCWGHVWMAPRWGRYQKEAIVHHRQDLGETVPWNKEGLLISRGLNSEGEVCLFIWAAASSGNKWKKRIVSLFSIWRYNSLSL